jgi:hypothetical protein
VVYDDHHTNLVADHSAGQLGRFVSSGAHPQQLFNGQGVTTGGAVAARSDATSESVALVTSLAPHQSLSALVALIDGALLRPGWG